MVKISELILIILWFPQALYQIFIWLYWCQVKEYRSDRFVVLLRSRSGKRELGISTVVIKLLLILFFIFYLPSIYIVYLLFIVLDLKIVAHLLKREIRRHIFTNRTLNILLTWFFFILLILFLYFKVSGISISLTIFHLEIILLLSLFLVV